MTTPVTILLTPSTPVSAVSVTALLRSDTGLPPTGVSLPMALAPSGAAWTGAFSDATPPQYYTATATLTTLGGIVSAPFTFPVDGSDDAIPAGAYCSVADANRIAAALPSALIAAWLSAGGTDQTAALIAASADIDAGQYYQGRRYDPAQAFEFPRVAYLKSPPGLQAFAAIGIPPGILAGPSDTIWDWDPVNGVAVIPPAVLQAAVYQANYILAGGDPRLDDIHGGVTQSTNSGLQETYDRSAPGPDSGLCQRAYRLLYGYLLRSGRML